MAIDQPKDLIPFDEMEIPTEDLSVERTGLLRLRKDMWKYLAASVKYVAEKRDLRETVVPFFLLHPFLLNLWQQAVLPVNRIRAPELTDRQHMCMSFLAWTLRTAVDDNMRTYSLTAVELGAAKTNLDVLTIAFRKHGTVGAIKAARPSRGLKRDRFDEVCAEKGLYITDHFLERDFFETLQLEDITAENPKIKALIERMENGIAGLFARGKFDLAYKLLTSRKKFKDLIKKYVQVFCFLLALSHTKGLTI